jgi:uncharacterized membrane protein
MSYLIAGIIIFAGIHLVVMLAPQARDRIKAQMGEGPWKGVFTLVSLIGLALMIYGWVASSNAPEAADLVYTPAGWTRHAAMLLVLVGVILIGAAHGKGRIKLWVKQPMSLGIGLWAFAHLLANGQRYDIWLFGTFLAIAVIDIIASTARGKIPHYEPRLRSDIIAVVVGIVLYLVFLFGFHPYILGVPVLA